MTNQTMKRLTYTGYGAADVLSWTEVQRPEPGAHEVLIEVAAASINPTDSKIRSGELKFMGLLKKFPRGMGMDVSGTVAAVGSGVSTVRVGQRVLAMSKDNDAFADFTLAAADAVVAMPDAMTFAQGACVPMGGGTAVGATKSLAVQSGTDVLVNGAAGGIGQFVVQLARIEGAHVEATGSAASLETLRALGAEQAFDYHAFDPSRRRGRYDKVLDMSGTMTFDTAKPMLREGGTFATMTPGLGSVRELIGTAFAARKSRMVFATVKPAAVQEIVSLWEAGKLTINVGLERPLGDAVETLRLAESGDLKATGKIVLVA